MKTKIKAKNIFTGALAALFFALSGVTFCHVGGGATPSLETDYATSAEDSQAAIEISQKIAEPVFEQTRLEVEEKYAQLDRDVYGIEVPTKDFVTDELLLNLEKWAIKGDTEPNFRGVTGLTPIGTEHIEGSGTEEEPYLVHDLLGFEWWMLKDCYLDWFLETRQPYTYMKYDQPIDFAGFITDMRPTEQISMCFSGEFGAVDDPVPDFDYYPLKNLYFESQEDYPHPFLPIGYVISRQENAAPVPGVEGFYFNTPPDEVNSSQIKNFSYSINDSGKYHSSSGPGTIVYNIEGVSSRREGSSWGQVIDIFDMRLINLPRISELYAEDIAAWQKEDGTINAIDSDADISGSGVQGDPYVIKTVRGWLWFYLKTTSPAEPRTYVYATLGADIDFAGIGYDLGFKMDMSSGNIEFADGFYGELDGKGYEIKNVLLLCGLESAGLGLVGAPVQCGLFNGLGVSDISFNKEGEAMIGMPTTFESEQSVLKNIKFSNMQNVAISMLGMYYSGVVAGVTYNTKFENVEVEFLYYNDMPDMGGNIGGGVIGVDYGKTELVGCKFLVWGRSVCFTSVVGVNVPVIDVSLRGKSKIENCTLTAKIWNSPDYASFQWFGGFCMTGYDLLISNCQTNGQVCFYGLSVDVRSGCAAGMVGGVFGDENPSEVKVENCQNNATFAGAYVNGIAYCDYISTFPSMLFGIEPIYDNASLNIVNCRNYGAMYGLIGNDSTKSTVCGGIVSYEPEGNINVRVENCKNYGNLYCGQISGGIVGYAVGNGTLVSCENYGNIYYPLPYDDYKISGATCAGIAVYENGCNVTITNCVSSAKFTEFNKSEVAEMGYSSFIPTYVGSGLIFVGAFSDYSSSASTVDVSGCTVTCDVVGGSSMFGGLFERAGTAADSVISIQNCCEILRTDLPENDDLRIVGGLGHFNMQQMSFTMKNVHIETYDYAMGVLGIISYTNQAKLCDVSDIDIMQVCDVSNPEYSGALLDEDGIYNYKIGISDTMDENSFFPLPAKGNIINYMVYDFGEENEENLKGANISLYENSMTKMPENSIYGIVVRAGKKMFSGGAITNDSINGENWFYSDELDSLPHLRKPYYAAKFIAPQDDVVQKLVDQGWTIVTRDAA